MTWCKSSWYEASDNPLSERASMFVEPDPHLHSAARRKIAAGYSMTSLVQLKSFVDACSEVLRSRASIDVSCWMRCYAFDVIGMITVRRTESLLT